MQNSQLWDINANLIISVLNQLLPIVIINVPGIILVTRMLRAKIIILCSSPVWTGSDDHTLFAEMLLKMFAA